MRDFGNVPIRMPNLLFLEMHDAGKVSSIRRFLIIM
jgi:hypothetical protein